MPDNLDMGGFGSPGLPVLRRLDGTIVTAGTINNTVIQSPAATAKAFRVDVPSLQNAATLPAEWQQRGTKFAVDNNGDVWNASGNFRSAGLYAEFFSQAYTIMFSPGNARVFEVNNSNYAAVSSTGFFGINSGSIAATTPDVRLYRDAAAGTLAQRNGTTAQTLRVYGTYTDASNYVRASLAATSTTVTLAAETAGTGADNVPVVITPAGTSQIEVGNGVQFTEMTAPSAPERNKVILYAQDNGAGKTQLMALFATGASQQVAIEP